MKEALRLNIPPASFEVRIAGGRACELFDQLGGELLVRIERQDPIVGGQRGGEIALRTEAQPSLPGYTRTVRGSDFGGSIGAAGIDDDLLCREWDAIEAAAYESSTRRAR